MQNKTRLTDAKARKLNPPESGQKDHYDNDVPGLSLRVSSKGTKTWCYVYRFVSKSKRLTLGRYPDVSIKEARVMARGVAVDVAQGIDPVVEKRRLKREREREQDSTLAKVAVRFMREYERGAAHTDRPDDSEPLHRTWKKTQSLLDKYILPHLGSYPLSEIARADIRELLAPIHEQAPYMANYVFATIRKLYSWAVAVDLVETSPCFGMKKPHKAVPRNHPLSEEEILSFWNACITMGYPFGDAFRLLLITGQRLNEVCAMTESELDVRNDEWVLPPERTKSKRRHVLPLTPLAMEVVGGLSPENTPFLFTTMSGVKPISGQSKAKKRLCELSGLEKFCLKDLRETVGTVMRERLGISSDVIGQVLNHAPQGVTQRHYAASHSPKDMRNALLKWDGYLDRLVHETRADNVVQFPGAS